STRCRLRQSAVRRSEGIALARGFCGTANKRSSAATKGAQVARLPACGSGKLRGVGGMQTELGQFFLHRRPGNAQPSDNLGLVAAGPADGLPEQLALDYFREVGEHVFPFFSLGAG